MAATAASNNESSFVKALVESTPLKSVPNEFTFINDSKGSHSDSIPIVDFSLLISPDQDQRPRALHDLAKACEDWGFFVLVNHGIPKALMMDIIKTNLEFFELPEEDKRRYEAKSALDPITSGTGSIINAANHQIHLWRDFLKCNIHPDFHYPEKPENLRDILREFSKRTRFVFRKLLQGISENLGLEHGYMDEALKLDSCFQMYAANFYPPCPEPDQAIGLPPHTDYGLLTLLTHNGVAGLQIQRNGQWFDINSPQNSILINTGDHLEIFSNGRYKCLNHKALVNSEATRISIVVANGAAPDAVVGPAAPLVERDGRPMYRPMKFIEYVETKLSNKYEAKGTLESLKIEYE